MRGSTACIVFNVPRQLMAITRSQNSGVESTNGTKRSQPATLIKAPMGPTSASTFAIVSRTASVSTTSTPTPDAPHRPARRPPVVPQPMTHRRPDRSGTAGDHGHVLIHGAHRRPCRFDIRPPVVAPYEAPPLGSLVETDDDKFATRFVVDPIGHSTAASQQRLRRPDFNGVARLSVRE
jgi:hypothetical protein